MNLSLDVSSEGRINPTVMIIDDQSTSRNILTKTLQNIDSNISIKSFESASDALIEAQSYPPDLIITDYIMPVMNGIEFTKKIRLIPSCNDIPIIMITIMKEKSVLYEALENGVTDFLSKPFDKIEYKSKCKNLLQLGKQHANLKNKTLFLTQQINASAEEILVREKETLDRLMKACSYKDCVTGEHLLRIGRISYILAIELGVNQNCAEILKTASSLHDIGKIAISDEILMKKSRLSADEFEIMKTHTTIGYEILKDSPSPYLQVGASIALNHHEKFDGSGYPNGLSAHNIPIEARIVAVADIFDSLTNHRPYKKAWSVKNTIEYIKNEKNRHLDPECVDALLYKLDEILAYP